MTIFFASSSITIYRARAQGNNKYVYSATLTGYSADIQPLDPERIEIYNGRMGKTWAAFIDSSVDVKEGDIIVTDGKRYGVKAVSTWQSAGLLDHRELIIESKDNA